MGRKVDALVERHGLTVPATGYDSVDEFLEARWTGSDGRSSDGYESLTEWFNERLLKRAYEEQGRDTMRVNLDPEYDFIVGDSGVRRDEHGVPARGESEYPWSQPIPRPTASNANPTSSKPEGVPFAETARTPTPVQETERRRDDHRPAAAGGIPMDSPTSDSNAGCCWLRRADSKPSDGGRLRFRLPS